MRSRRGITTAYNETGQFVSPSTDPGSSAHECAMRHGAPATAEAWFTASRLTVECSIVLTSNGILPGAVQSVSFLVGLGSQVVLGRLAQRLHVQRACTGRPLYAVSPETTHNSVVILLALVVNARRSWISMATARVQVCQAQR